MLSTKHDASKTNVRTRYMSNTLLQYTNNTCTHTAYSHRRGHLKEKPTVVADYNLYMLGVDKLDQMMSYYSFLHKSVKWWRKVFFWLLEVAVVNAYIIYKEEARRRGATPITHLAFRRRLIQSLSEPIRSCVTPHARSGPRVAQNVERLQPVPHFLHKGRKRRDCVVCSDREEGGTRHLTLFHCATCPDNPSLCPATCFEAYHTQRLYRH